MTPSSSNGSSTLADLPFTSSERKFALLSQTSLPPPKTGSVWSAALVGRIALAAPSTLSAAPSIISSPNSPASAGASFLASSAASRFTLASSEPTIARMLAVAVLFLALGMATYFIANARWFSKRYRRLSLTRSGGFQPPIYVTGGLETAVPWIFQRSGSTLPSAAESSQNLWRRNRETFLRAMSQSQICRSKCGAAQFRKADAGPTHRATPESSAYRSRPESAPTAPIHHKKFRRDRKVAV